MAVLGVWPLQTCSKSSPSGNPANLEITVSGSQKVVSDLGARAGIISRTFLWILKQIPCTLAVIPQVRKFKKSIERIMKLEEVGRKAFVLDLAVVGGGAADGGGGGAGAIPSRTMKVWKKYIYIILIYIYIWYLYRIILNYIDIRTLLNQLLAFPSSKSISPGLSRITYCQLSTKALFSSMLTSWI